jgi:hypothetical protein
MATWAKLRDKFPDDPQSLPEDILALYKHWSSDVGGSDRTAALNKMGTNKPPPDESGYRVEGKSRDLTLARVDRSDETPLEFSAETAEWYGECPPTNNVEGAEVPSAGASHNTIPSSLRRA